MRVRGNGCGGTRGREMSGRHIGAAIVAAVWAGAAGTAFALETRECALDAAGMERDAQLVSLQFDRTENAILLAKGDLVEDDAPAVGVPEGLERYGFGWKEPLKKGVVIRKILVLDNPAADAGRLVFNGFEAKNNETPLHISLNGVEFLRPPSQYACPYAKQYTTFGPNDRWFFVDLPVGALKKGANEILMWAESDSLSWVICIAADKEFARGSLTRTSHPNRSMRSLDGGKTWNDSLLGGENSLDGEYCIRMNLDRYFPSGEYVSPVTDMIDGASVLKRAAKIARAEFSAGVDVPAGTAVEILARFGASPRVDDPSWTEWGALPADGVVPALGNRRYVQWKARASTTNPCVSPRLRNVSWRVEYEEASPNDGLGVAVQVVHNGHVARSSYPFVYENLLHPELEKYRKNARLDKIVEGAGSEFEVMMRLLHWAYRVPVTNNDYSWNWNDAVKLEKGEGGMPKLQMNYTARRRDAMCLFSNQALIGALLSMGFQARHINIDSEASGGHEVTEVWSDEFNKWIYMDATRDYYYFNPDTGLPLNFLEIHNLIVPLMPRVETWARPFAAEHAQEVVSKVRVGMREGGNAVSIAKDGRHILEIAGYFRIIPRNDFLTNPRPVPVRQGASMWGWDGFLNHYDDLFPKREEYDFYSDRALDFYEPLNQTEITLAETGGRGGLAAVLNTFTPGFDTFLVRVDNGRWTAQTAPEFLWKLRAGMNRIEARVRNVRGVLGPVSTLDVTYNP